ncbi:MAG: Coenzyme F420 hydrogenase/dehydrogenase, beta subunit C-terminal domain [Clostridia bacterium]|nr:Coenzyme F420 hydrogenase/dehydrogenase, beta subunit C-terminal domain [Clostridia bacterium]
MIYIENKEKCSGCHACVDICPKSCISMVSDNEGFLYPKVDESTCIKCGLCVKACPIITPKERTKSIDGIKAYGAYSNTKEIRRYSSSGGLFTEIATYIINNGGVVFGAAFNEDFSVSHKMVDTIEGLSVFRGSKYVQSTIGNTYKEAKELLTEGKLVLFTGTPCQIGGLYSYLGKDYENLITQDIICHGVPSPMVWQKYKEYQENKNNSTINAVQFRNKDSGWKSYSVVLGFDNDKEYRQKSGNDLYIKSFLTDLCLRPSCYNCSFKGKVRESDITLADFWGIENVIPEMDNDKGISLMLVNSLRGQALFEKIKDNVTYKETDLDEALKYNSAAVESVTKPKNREKFIRTVNNQGFEKASKKYLGVGTISYIKRILRKILRKIKR